jgi:hypothetical protein
MLLQILSPCPMAWEQLAGDGQTRFCDQCNLHVTDLSDMSDECARDFVRAKKAKGERVCGRIKVRLPLLAAAAAALSLAGCTAQVGTETEPEPQPEPVQAAAPAAPAAANPQAECPKDDPDCKIREIHMLGDVSE